MSPESIGKLLQSWRDAERAREGGPKDGEAYSKANAAVDRARRAYLDAIRAQAAKFGYASGMRTVGADIDHLQEAEDRRLASEPSSPEYHQAAEDVRTRAIRIFDQVTEDEAAAEQQKKDER